MTTTIAPPSTAAPSSAHAPAVTPGEGATTRWHSVSSTREYERCPRRYRYAYVDRLPQDRHVPPAGRIGSAVHAALEAAHRHRMAHPDAPTMAGLHDDLAPGHRIVGILDLALRLGPTTVQIVDHKSRGRRPRPDTGQGALPRRVRAGAAA